MTIKKNVPYKVLKGLWIALIGLVILNIIGLWVGWNGRETELYEGNSGAVAFGVVAGVLVLLDLIAMAVAAFLSQKVEKRMHGWVYGLLGLVHLIFVILTFTITKGGDNTCPALFTVFLIAIIAVCVYFALAGKHPTSAFGKVEKESDLAPIRREDLGANPTDAVADVVANPENNPDRKAGRDEKTGIVSL